MKLFAFITASAVLVINLCSEKYRQDDLDVTLSELDGDDNLPRIQTYDFIIVGGGGAGCVLANRLSTLCRVLLLEAGGTPVPATRVQLFSPVYSVHPAINYQYYSVPQINTALESGGVFKIIEGKMLGGSTSHNDLVYDRGNPLDYNHWASLLNDSSWEYQNILKYFKKSEHFVSRGNPGQHGRGGLMTVRTEETRLLPYWLRAGVELGFPETSDFNGPQTESYGAAQVTQKRGKRESSYTAFIEPIEKARKNLRIERYSHVSEILIDDNKRAYGVAYTRHGIPQIAHATKEVIVSCGGFGSPLLLMKSGIGPSSTLKDAGIKIVNDLPVGKTLFQHIRIGLSFSINSLSVAPSPVTDLTEESLEEYHNQGTGVLANSQQFGLAALISTRAEMNGESNWPDLELILNGVDNRVHTPASRDLEILTTLGRPESKGVFDLNTTAYKAGYRSNEKLAVIDYKFLGVSSDEDVLLEGLKVAMRTIENTTAFQELGAKYIAEKDSSCSKFKFRTDEYWRCYIQQRTTASHHESGTCRMGFGLEDKNAVLDSKFNVLGMSNLRVVDASAIPYIPNGHTAATVIMMAERAADEILKATLSKHPTRNSKFAHLSD